MGDVLAVRDVYRAQNWAMLIQECNASGLTNREFCQQRGISEKSYYYWLRKIRNQISESTTPQLVQVDSVRAENSELHIQYRSAEMRLPGNIDINAVAALLRSIQST